MKRKALIGLFIFIIIILVSINIYNSQIPNLKLTYKNKKVEVLKCPFSWDTLLNRKNWDYATPPELAKALNATTVEPESALNFNFTNTPDSFEVTLWNGKPEQYKSNKNGIVVPKEKGTYLFAVIGCWQQGQVLYIFKINVN